MKLQGEGRGEELREGASHSLLVKAFTDSHVVGYIRDKRVLFGCLASDCERRACIKARPCNIHGCKRNHHHLLDGFARGNKNYGGVVSPREEAPAQTL